MTHDAFNHEEAMAYGRTLIAKTFGEDALVKTNLDIVNEWWIRAVKRAEEAEAKVARVLALAEEMESMDYLSLSDGWGTISAREIRTAVTDPEERK